MTWKLTVRSNPGSTVTADYECPHHGRFEVTVLRAADGDPPAGEHCTKMLETWAGTMRCWTWSPHVMSSAGALAVKRGEVVRGKSDARPSEKHVMDTSLLADGMPVDEWKKRRAAVHRDESLRRVRTAFGKTPKVWSR